MIKKFSPGDITVRPFKTFKNWTVQSVDINGTDSFGRSTYIDNCCEINHGTYQDPTVPVADTDAVNPSGKLERVVYQSIRAMFYENAGNDLQTFGVEYSGTDVLTGKKEVRELGESLTSVRLFKNKWGEKVRPSSVKIEDNSNIHAPHFLYDDGYTNLFATGSHFLTHQELDGFEATPPTYYWNTSSGYFVQDGEVIDLSTAKERMDMGFDVQYVSGSASWDFDPSKEDHNFHSENEKFGSSVAVWNRYVVVGSPMTTTNLDVGSGYAAIFKYDESQSLHRPIKKFYSPFSPSAISQSVDTDTDWYRYLQSINYFATASLDGFGASVSVSDNFIVVGAPDTKLYDQRTGAAYVYYKYKGGLDHWGIVSALVGEDDLDQFGQSVAIDGNVMVVGAPGVNGSTGAAYVFRKHQFMGTGSYSLPTSSFFQSVSTERSPFESVVTEDGVLVAVERTAPTFISGNYTWILEAKLTSSWAQSNDRFGACLDIDNDRVIVGCETERAGFATLFVCSYTSASLNAQPTASWTEYSTYQANSSLGDLPNSPIYSTQVTLAYDGFGRAVAIEGDNLIIGSWFDKAFKPYVGSPDSDAVLLGAAYFYRYQYDSECSTFDYTLIFKSFGNRDHTTNNDFARAVDVAGDRVVVSAAGYPLTHTVHANGNVDLLAYESSASEDLVLGRIQTYRYDAVGGTWKTELEVKLNKEADHPGYRFSDALALTEDFLACGGPISITSDEVVDPNLLPESLSGRAFIYDFEEMQVDPKVGNVFYRNGLVVLTNTASYFEGMLMGTGSMGFTAKYQGTHTIFENECLVQIKPGEFNYSTNPSALIQNAQVFDVNQDGVFDIRDINLIMKYLNKKRFSDSTDFSDNGIELEQATDSWWASSVLLLESEDVLLLEGSQANELADTSFRVYTRQIHDYIETNLVQTQILDIDGNGTIDLRDGNILLAYYLDKLTPTVLTSYLDAYSTRRYVKDVTIYLDRYTGNRQADVDPNFFNYQASSSFDPTGSYLAPYITTIGLYDEGGELVAVSKLGRPIKNLIDWPINIVVRFDT